MCLIFVAHDCHADYRLILASNRDEFYARPTAPAAFWEDQVGLFGGRDLEQGGAWLAVNRTGRFAAITNYRDPAEFERKGLSRGLLLKNLLTDPKPVREFFSDLQTADVAGSAYNAYNVLGGDIHESGELHWHSNKAPKQIPTRLVPGVYGLSNHLLDTPWPKVVSGRTAFAHIVLTESQPKPAQLWHQNPEPFFEVLADRTLAPDAALPDTGIGIDKERFLSSRFISSEVYGTRASSLLFVLRSGLVVFYERRFTAGGVPAGESRHEFHLR